MEIQPRTFVISTEFWGRQLHLFLLQGDHDLLLIDTGLAGMPKELIFPYMQAHGLALDALTLAASTHAHADHMGGNAEIQAACPNVRLGAHELDRPWIEDHELLCREVYDLHPEMGLFSADFRKLMLDVCGANSPVDIVWRGGEVLDLGSRLVEVVHAPGHTAGNIVFLDRAAGILVEAETILGGPTGEPGNLSVPYYYDVAIYRDTMRHLAELPWELLLSSHAKPRDRAAGLQAIRESIDFVDHFHEQVKAVLAERREPADFATLVRNISERFGYKLDLGLALLMDTHLDYLRRTKEAICEPDGRWMRA